MPISYTSGKHIANRTATCSLSFMTEFTSFPMYLAGFSTCIKISSLNASFLIYSFPCCLSFCIVFRLKRHVPFSAGENAWFTHFFQTRTACHASRRISLSAYLGALEILLVIVYKKYHSKSSNDASASIVSFPSPS